MHHREPGSRYLSYLLRIWQTADGEVRIWRASLESPGSGEQLGFASLADLFAYLEQITEDELQRGQPRLP